MSKIKFCVIHHSASYGGTVSIIDAWHKARGWGNPITGVSIGYNHIILNGFDDVSGKVYDPFKDGRIVEGRGLNGNAMIEPWEVGAHTLGYNQISIGVCCVGFIPTETQYVSLARYCRIVKEIDKEIKIVGHNELNKTKCPGFDVQNWLRREGIKN